MASINNKGGLVGGSEGEPGSGFTHPFFASGVKSIQLIGKNTYGVRILPAFDRNIDSGDPAFKLSVAPYRDIDKAEANPEQHSPFTSWYFTVKGYKFLGNDQRQFISPLSQYGKKDMKGVDPIFDIFFAAKNSGNPDWVCLVTKPTDPAQGYRSVIPLPSKFGIMNGLVDIEKSGEIENRAIICGSMCMDMLKDTLNTYRPAMVNAPVDPTWPNYLFGDVTSPAYGSWATVQKTVFNTANMADAGFHFSKKKDTLISHTPWPIDLDAEWGQAYLQGRYDFGDPGIVKILTAEEILDWVVADGFIPYELIEHACKNRWTVPADPCGATHFPPQEDSGGGTFQAPAPAVSRPSAPAAPAQRVSAPPVSTPRPTAPAAPGVRPAPPVSRPTAPAAAPARPAAAPARPTVSAPAAAPARPVAPAARPMAPGAAPRPATPVTPPRPSGGPAVRPPAAAPTRPVAAARPVAAPVPPPVEDQVPMEYPAESGAVAALSEAEVAEFNELQDLFTADPNALSAEQVQRYGELADRQSAAQ